MRGVLDPPWCSEPSERRHVGVVRVVRDALWAEVAARARFGVVRLVPVDGCGGGGGRGEFVDVGHRLGSLELSWARLARRRRVGLTWTIGTLSVCVLLYSSIFVVRLTSF